MGHLYIATEWFRLSPRKRTPQDLQHRMESFPDWLANDRRVHIMEKAYLLNQRPTTSTPSDLFFYPAQTPPVDKASKGKGRAEKGAEAYNQSTSGTPMIDAISAQAGGLPSASVTDAVIAPAGEPSSASAVTDTFTALAPAGGPPGAPLTPQTDTSGASATDTFAASAGEPTFVSGAPHSSSNLSSGK